MASSRHRSCTSNFGVPAVYGVLERNGVSVKRAIVIARYGDSWRGIKPKVAYEHGAVGALIYSDPRDDGFGAGETYDAGPFRMLEQATGAKPIPWARDLAFRFGIGVDRFTLAVARVPPASGKAFRISYLDTAQLRPGMARRRDETCHRAFPNALRHGQTAFACSVTTRTTLSTT